MVAGSNSEHYVTRMDSVGSFEATDSDMGGENAFNRGGKRRGRQLRRRVGQAPRRARMAHNSPRHGRRGDGLI